MGRREDFYKILNHQKPDKLILDLGGCPLSSIDGRSMYILMDYLGLEYDRNAVNNQDYGSIQRIDERILKYLDIDTRSVGTILKPKKSLFQKVSENEYIDEWGIGRRFTGMYWEIVSSPLKNASVEDLENYPWPDPETVDLKVVEGFRDTARDMMQNTDYVICGEHPVYGIFELGCWMCGFEDFLMKSVLDTDFVKRFFEIVLEYQKKIIEIYYGTIGPYIHYTSSGDDFATQTSSFISPDMFRELIKPYFKERISYTKKFTQAAFLHHSCGNVYHLIPELIDSGVEILNPIQPVSADMAPERLKIGYGDRICFHGGIDTQAILPFGTEDEINREVKRVVDIMSQDGGYIFAAAHNIQEDVPPENLVRMFKFAREVYK